MKKDRKFDHNEGKSRNADFLALESDSEDEGSLRYKKFEFVAFVKKDDAENGSL